MNNSKRTEREILSSFNSKADKLINSSLVKETNENKVKINFTWKHNKKINELDFSHQKSNFSTDAIDSFVLNLRFFIQDNESTSIRNMSKLYEEMSIPQEFKSKFMKMQINLNNFLDESVLTFVGVKLTRRQVYDVIIFGDIAHQNLKKSKLIGTWKKDQVNWDMIFYEFQKTLYEFIEHIKNMKFLNEKVLDQFL